jgi:glycosyltransferase involved in cell wall biosynthesis
VTSRAPDTAPARPIRVVYLGHVAQLSGSEIALLRLLRALDRVDAHVILAESGPLVDQLKDAGATVEVLAMSERARGVRRGQVRVGRSALSAVFETARYVVVLARRLRTLQPDVVHTESLKAGVYGSLAARLAHRKVIWHVHDLVDRGQLSPATAIALRLLIRHLPNAVIANSQATLATVGAGPSRHVVYPPIPAPGGSLERRAARARGDALAIGIVGRLAQWKGQDVLLRAFAQAFAEGANRLVIVGAAMFGDEDDAYAAGLHELAGSLGIADRVDFRGFREDVWSELVALDVLVHASLTPEPFGQVIVEGMAVGLPVVASAAGGPSEIISDRVNGLLYPPGDVAALAALLKLLDGDPALRASLGSAALTRAADFAPARAAAATRAIYEALLAR